MKRKRIRRASVIVGLVGLPGAGKTSVATYLQTKGYTRVTLSDFIKEEATRNGITRFTRESLQNYGNKMRALYGPQVLAQLALKKIRKEKPKKVIVDGIRNLYEAAYLRVENFFVFVGITAHPKIRYQRLLARKKQALVSTYKEFLRHEERESKLGSMETGLRVKECLKRTSYKIKNENTQEELYRKIDSLLAKIETK